MSDVNIKFGATAPGVEALLGKMIQMQEKLTEKIDQFGKVAARTARETARADEEATNRKLAAIEANKKAAQEAADARAKEKAAANDRVLEERRAEAAALSRQEVVRRGYAIGAALAADAAQQERRANEAARYSARVRINESAELEHTYQKRRNAITAAVEAESKTAPAYDGITTAITNATTGVLGFVASFASISTIISGVQRLETYMNDISKASDRAAIAMRSVAIQAPAGLIGRKMTSSVALQGAKSGFTMEETGQMANVIQSIPGADLQKEMQNAGTLHNLGIAGADIAPIIQTGIVRGIGGEKAGDLAARASELAPLDAGTVARYLPKTQKYTSLEAGLAAGTTLKTAGLVDEQIPYAVEALGRALSEDKSPLAKKFKLKGLTESERIQKLNEAADASGDRAGFIRSLPEKYKTGEEEGRALQMVLSRGNQFAQDEATLKQTRSGYANEKLRDLMQDPIQRAEIEGRASREVANVNKIYGPQGDASRAKTAYEQGLGSQIQKDMPSLAPYAVREDGTANWLGQAIEPFMKGRQAEGGPDATRISSMTPEQQRREGTSGLSEQTAKEIVDALNANTEATKANTGATGGGDGGPSIAQRRNR